MRHVLVVEDDKQIREALSDILKAEGYQVHVVTNGREAIDYLTSLQYLPSVILLDIMMPVMDGWQFRHLQAHDVKLNKIPVVVITADTNAQQNARRMNADGWIKKPININALLNAIEECSA